MLAASAIARPEPAPFLSEIAEGPDAARAWWVTSADGTRLRMGLWDSASGTPRGTVLLFPGRTEYVEKYGRVARDLAAAGYSVAAFDWRGQGLADRPPHRRDMGHVTRFDKYRQDVSAFRHALEELRVPGPLFPHPPTPWGGAIGAQGAS
jgi:Lysophospholipase